MQNKAGKVLIYLLKAAVTATILWIVFSKFELRDVLYSILHLPWQLVLMMLLTTIFKHYTQYRNWRLSLELNPRYVNNRREILSSYLIGNALRFLIPGGTATYGKMFYVQNTSRWASVIAVSSEKFFMTWTTWFFSGWAALLCLTSLPLWLRIAFVAGCSIFPIAVYFLLGAFKQTRELKISYGIKSPRIITFQMLYFCTTLLQLWLLLRQFMPLSFFKTAQRLSLTLFANTIPITISGLGLRESFAVYFLEPLGLSAEQAISATLSLFLFHDLIPALLGAFILLKTRKLGNLKD
ncbi:MAG: lysylphosphatidylglycerol synthase domain-containing protein [Candidatus Cloacimonetes bacterium]|nr:lysylphosphatidylglycerol synthase domain-containing protein [Candidatus Cloacimonadota bacterium]